MEIAQEARERALESHSAIWIHVLEQECVASHVEHLQSIDIESAPLWGIPFAIKDNIDLAGTPTTAACPKYEYLPDRSATVVQRLLDAGAIPIGKTNLDQFATGLTGTRSPYGAVPNVKDSAYIAGGSSSGSAIAVANGTVQFALGTDTAGSGRIPAAFNGLIGFKPTRGWFSTRGVVPACRSLDCVSVFTNNIEDTCTIAKVLGAFDYDDAFSRHVESKSFDRASSRIGYFNPDALPWTSNGNYSDLYGRWISELPDDAQSVDPAPFLEAGELLYRGPWLAERLAVLEEFFDREPQAIHPVTRSVIEGGRNLTAIDCFRAEHRLAGLRREVEKVFHELDIIAMPTSPIHPTLAEVEKDPRGTNAYIGTFAHCVNLLDLCAIALPCSSTPQGLPFGITLLAQAEHDHALLRSAAVLVGDEPLKMSDRELGRTVLAVCGAHMSGQPRNKDLTSLGAYRVAQTRTARRYRFFALPDGKRPALIRSDPDGASIEVELWSLADREVGRFLSWVESPLAIGMVELHDGRWIHGFIGDSTASVGAEDITHFGSWLTYRDARSIELANKS